jgi:DNA-binding NarL/FixJ family response regulator
MARGICLISAGQDGGKELAGLFQACGLEVWTPQSAEDARIYGAAMCLVIDMPGEAGYRTLRLFRDYGIATPALLIVDRGSEVAISELKCGNVMDIIPRDAGPLRIMRWIQSMVAASSVLDQAQRLSA